VTEAHGIPLGTVAAAANRRDDGLLAATLDTLVVVGVLPARPVVHLDAGYDYRPCRQALAEHRMVGEIATRGVPAQIQASRRWPVERTHAWGNQYGKLRWCTERRRLVVAFWLARPTLPSCVAGHSAAPGPATAGKAVRAAAPDHLLAQALTCGMLSSLRMKPPPMSAMSSRRAPKMNTTTAMLVEAAIVTPRCQATFRAVNRLPQPKFTAGTRGGVQSPISPQRLRGQGLTAAGPIL
jgi:IS5 family transposase